MREQLATTVNELKRQIELKTTFTSMGHIKHAFVAQDHLSLAFNLIFLTISNAFKDPQKVNSFQRISCFMLHAHLH